MEGPGKLNDMLGSHKSEINNPKLDWAAINPAVKDALSNQKKKKRRRILFWWITGLLLPTIFFLLHSNNTPVVKNHVLEIQVDQNLPSKAISSQYERTDRITKTTQNPPLDVSTTMDKILSTEAVVKKTRASTDNLYINTASILVAPAIGHFQSKRSTSALGQPVARANILTDNITTIDKPQRVALAISSLNLRTLSTFAAEIDMPTPRATLVPVFPRVSPSSRATKIYQYGGITYSNLATLHTNTSSLLGSVLETTFAKRLKGNWTMQAGFRVQQLRFQTNFTQTMPITVYSPMTADTIYRYPDGVEEVVFTDSIAGTGTRTFGYSNKLTSVTVPINIGYVIQFKKITLTPQIGVALNIYEKQNFRIADDLYNIENTEQSSSLTFAPTYQAALGLDIPITQDIGLATRYVFSRESFTVTHDNTNQTVNGHSLQAGLYYNW